MNVREGDFVTFRGEVKTVYRVSRVDDRGQVHAYGGDPDARGRRGWRVVRLAMCKPALKKYVPR